VHSAMGTAIRSPLAWVLAVAFALRIVGIGWGLPASDGWDNDGVAPRDFLAGLVETFTPGKFYVYPTAHLLLLATLTSPVTTVALAKAPSLAPHDVIHEIIKVPYMTVIALVARLTTILLSLGIVYAVAKMAEELRGRRAGWCAAAVCTVNAPLTYYAKTSNLDVPYLFWGCLALLALVRAVARREPGKLRVFALCAALAVGTKDQAYALFVLGVPATFALWLATDSSARVRVRVILRELAGATLVAAVLLLVIDAAVINPSGFRSRLAFLTGPASQDFVNYTNDWRGRAIVIEDAVAKFGWFYPSAFAGLMVFGVVIGVRAQGKEKARIVAALVPLLAALSFTFAFNCVARRTEHRFLLPQAILAAVYAGIAVDRLAFETRARVVRSAAQVLVGAAFALAFFGCISVDANLVLDRRYDAEAWLATHVAAGDSIEVHGLNVYLPRLPANASVTRVGPDATDRRSPLPGVVEVQDTYGHASLRRPRFIIESEGWVWRYLSASAEPESLPRGRLRAPTLMEHAADRDAVTFFHQLFEGTAGYRLAHVSSWTTKVWPRIDYHSSTSRQIWIFERED
jgi:hypothetical protein